jgi:hypothetical protein
METYTQVDAPADPDQPGPDHAHAAAPVRPRRFGWLREGGLVLGFYYVYQTIRSIANHGNVSTRAFANANRLVGWERTLHIFNEQRVQQFFLSARWFIKFLNVYYGTLHFIITAGLLIWIYHYRHAAYRRARNLLGATTALAIIGYWSFPLAPPRMQKWDGFVDTLDTIGGLWSYNSGYAKAVANPFAAMPSLHFGWALWCGLMFFTLTTRRWTRSMLVLYPLMTLTAIVVTANHYWLDAAGGAVIFLTAFAILHLVDRRASRRSGSSASPQLEPLPTTWPVSGA